MKSGGIISALRSVNLEIFKSCNKVIISNCKSHTCHNSFGPNRDFDREFGLDIGIFSRPILRARDNRIHNKKMAKIKKMSMKG